MALPDPLEPGDSPSQPRGSQPRRPNPMRGRVARNGDTPASNGNVANIITVVRILLAPLFVWLLIDDAGDSGRSGTSRPRCSSSRSPRTASTGCSPAARTSSPTPARSSTRSPTRCSSAARSCRCRSSASCGGGSPSSSSCASSASRSSASPSSAPGWSPPPRGQAEDGLPGGRDLPLPRADLAPARRLDALGQLRRHGDRPRPHRRDRRPVPGERGDPQPPGPRLSRADLSVMTGVHDGTAGGRTPLGAAELSALLVTSARGAEAHHRGGRVADRWAAGRRADPHAGRIIRRPRGSGRVQHGTQAHRAGRGCRAARGARAGASGGGDPDGARRAQRPGGRRGAADVGIATTGVAGPDPQGGHAPGTAFIGISTPRDGVFRRVSLSLGIDSRSGMVLSTSHWCSWANSGESVSSETVGNCSGCDLVTD